jgi:hypothetical protein
MPSRPLQTPEPEDGSGSRLRRDQAAAEPAPATPVTRARILTGRYLARHPQLMTALKWLGWNNPGGSINP